MSKKIRFIIIIIKKFWRKNFTFIFTVKIPKEYGLYCFLTVKLIFIFQMSLKLRQIKYINKKKKPYSLELYRKCNVNNLIQVVDCNF